MGYFSNGTEGMMYEEKYCSKCIHGGNCAVWDAHMLRNYDECNNDKSILHLLIPRDGIHNERCLMYVHGKPRPPYHLKGEIANFPDSTDEKSK